MSVLSRMWSSSAGSFLIQQIGNRVGKACCAVCVLGNQETDHGDRVPFHEGKGGMGMSKGRGVGAPPVCVRASNPARLLLFVAVLALFQGMRCVEVSACQRAHARRTVCRVQPT